MPCACGLLWLPWPALLIDLSVDVKGRRRAQSAPASRSRGWPALQRRCHDCQSRGCASDRTTVVLFGPVAPLSQPAPTKRSILLAQSTAGVRDVDTTDRQGN